MFSIIIPAYNAEKFLETAIKSVLNQTYDSFELIIVDDGSTDGTRNIVKLFTDDRIKYIYQKNGGVSHARNTGIEASTKEFVCFLDSDDEWRKNHLEVLACLINKYHNCGMYITGYDIRLRNGTLVHKSIELLKRIENDNFMSNDGYETFTKYGYFFNTNTVCCRKAVFAKVGMFATGVRNGEDDDMWFRIFAYYPIAISKESTTIYNRINSVATRQRVNDTDQTFLGRVNGILADEEVPVYRKESLSIWIEKNKLSKVRQYILSGSKKDARRLLKTIDYSKVNTKRYIQTFICIFVPTVFIKNIINRRDKEYFDI